MIYAGKRRFQTAQELIDSAETKGLAKTLIGDRIEWWRDLVVRFGEENSSCSFVEVEGLSVTVGYPTHYKTFRFDSTEEALRWAEATSAEWQNSSVDWRDFVNSLETAES